jgi:AcrR family transcriptional regulator
MKTEPVPKLTFKQRMLVAREEAIVHAVNRLLAEKGFEAMTVDEVAAQVGIAKASLYKHFPSKEDLAAAAMVRVMRRAQAYLAALPDGMAPLDNTQLPAIAILYTFFARACDPVVEFLKMGELFTDEQIVEMVVTTCFDGLNTR